MANQKQLEILKSGVENWNEYRANNVEVTPNFRQAKLSSIDLSNAHLGLADFSGADLSGADFSGASLYMASFRNVNLFETNFKNADLSSANLCDADLKSADLSHVHMGNADLSGANLTNAILRGAIFYRTNLSGANLSKTIMTNSLISSTSFVGIDLSKTKGLETCRFYGESYIDYYTLKQSGTLPIHFLRGCGLSDQYIEHIPSLFNKAIQFYSCFISYSSKDEELAQKIHADLQNKGIRCWFAPEDLKIGDKTRSVIHESIRVYDKLLLIISENSIKSQWVEDEVESALGKEREQKNKPVLFPIRKDDKIFKVQNGWAVSLRNTRNIGDFTNWKDHDSYKMAFDRLVRDLKQEHPEKSK